MVHEGNLVRANDTTPLVVINQVTPIYVSFAIPEARLPELKRYLAQGTLRVEAQPPNDDAARRRTGASRSSTTPSIRRPARSRSRHVPERPIAGSGPASSSTSSSTLTTDPNAIVVPTAAVQAGQQGTYVFVVKPDQTVELRPVDGRADQRRPRSVIKSGLKPGETVVTDGQLRLVPGSRVSVKNGEPQKVAS